MDPDGRKVAIEHGDPCHCKVLDGVIYVATTCKRIGHHVTKRRITQLLHSMKGK